MKLTLKPFVIAAAVLAGPVARAGSTYDPLTGDLRDSVPSVESTDVPNGEAADADRYGAASGEPEEALKDDAKVRNGTAYQEQERHWMESIWTQP